MRALFVSYGGGHIEMCLPVMQALRRRLPACELKLMALTTAAGVARQAGESPLAYADFMRGDDAALARVWGERLLPGHEHSDVRREESVAYLGLNFMEWVHGLGEAGAIERWKSQGRHGFLPLRFFTRVLRELLPDVVVATNSPRSEQAVVAAAAALGIPSLSMLDLFGLPGEPFLARPVHADRITVLSDAVAANLVSAGIPRDRIAVTGNPAFDELVRPEAVARGQDWRAARGWQDKHVVLWAGDREPEDAHPRWAGTALGKAVQQRLLQWLDHRDDVALVIRYHPNTWRDFTRPAAHPRIHWSRPGQEGLTPMLMGVDQVVVQISTVGVQAFTCGKGLVNLGFSPMVQRTGNDYSALGMGRRADDLDDMIELLERGMERSSGPARVLHGGAAERVAQLVAALAAGKTES